MGREWPANIGSDSQSKRVQLGTGPQGKSPRRVHLSDMKSFHHAPSKCLQISATSTCGEDYVSQDGRGELYCKLVGANWQDNVNKHIYGVSPTIVLCSN